MYQASLTVVAAIERSELDALRGVLASIKDQVQQRKLTRDDGAVIPFGDLTTVHFARFVVLDPPAREPGVPPLLLFATSCDGSRVRHVRELIEVAGKGLETVFSHCTDFRGDRSGELAERLSRFFASHSQEPDAFWRGHPGRSVYQIYAESRLHAELERELGRSSGRLCSEPFEYALRCVREREDLRWALTPPDPTRVPWLRKGLLLAAFGLGVLALLLPVLIPWLLCIRVRELLEDRARRPDHTEPELLDAREQFNRHKRELLEDEDLGFEDEDLGVQNQMTAVSELQPGRLRLATLRTVLWAVDFLGRNYWDHGHLHGIRTIHFARWLVLRQGNSRRLVFFSNYDGTWEHYLGEFIDDAPSGLTGIWSNTVRIVKREAAATPDVVPFPKTRWLFRSGARREAKFKRFVRACQVRTQVWYSAYPKLSALNVQNNSQLRRGLQGLRRLEERLAWLRRL